MKTVMMMEGLVAMVMVMGEVEVVVVVVVEVEGVEGVGVAVEVEVPGEARVGLHRHLLLVEDEVVVLGAEGQHHPLHRMTRTTRGQGRGRTEEGWWCRRRPEAQGARPVRVRRWVPRP